MGSSQAVAYIRHARPAIDRTVKQSFDASQLYCQVKGLATGPEMSTLIWDMNIATVADETLMAVRDEYLKGPAGKLSSSTCNVERSPPKSSVRPMSS